MRRPGLNRHITVSMSLMVLSVIVMTILSSCLLWAVLVEFFPASALEQKGWLPTGPELAWMASVTVVGLALALATSIRLTRRIVSPLNTLVESVRALTDGDLGVRASASDDALDEVALLVEDFNTMAARLQHMDRERTLWHAAIAHELRTPLTILRGRLQGLADGVFQPDEAQFRSLLAQVEGLSRLIEDLRVLGLAGNGRLDVRRARTDVVQEVHSVMTMVDPAFRNAGSVLRWKPTATNTLRIATRPACVRPCSPCLKTRAATPAQGGCGFQSRTARTTCSWPSKTTVPVSMPSCSRMSSIRSCAARAHARAKVAAADSAWPWSRQLQMPTAAVFPAAAALKAAAASCWNYRASKPAFSAAERAEG